MTFLFDTFGQTNRQPLVLLHGFGSHRHIWQPLVPKLIDHFNLYLVDLPGYGDNESFDSSTLDLLCEPLVNYLPTNAIWLGWSLGGLAALHIALTSPQQTAGCITIASSPHFLASKTWPGLDREKFFDFCEGVEKFPAKTLQQFQLLQVHGDKEHKALLQWLLAMHIELPPKKTLQQGLNLLKETDFRHKLHRLSTPYLSILGANDQIVPVAVSSALLKLAPQAHSTIIPNASHLPFLSSPTMIADQIKHFAQTTGILSIVFLTNHFVNLIQLTYFVL